jgi:hypothetical protein
MTVVSRLTRRSSRSLANMSQSSVLADSSFQRIFEIR